MTAKVLRSPDPPPDQLRLELELYRWAAGSAEQREQAHQEVVRLLRAGVRSPGWNFDSVLDVAAKDGRPDLAELRAAAATAAAPE